MNVTSLEPKCKITPNYSCNIISKLFFFFLNQNMFKVEGKFCQANNHCALVEKKKVKCRGFHGISYNHSRDSTALWKVRPRGREGGLGLSLGSATNRDA